MTKTKRASPPAPTSPVPLPVFEYRGQLVADSRDMAELIGRTHWTLIRSIRTYCNYLMIRIG